MAVGYWLGAKAIQKRRQLVRRTTHRAMRKDVLNPQIPSMPMSWQPGHSPFADESTRQWPHPLPDDGLGWPKRHAATPELQPGSEALGPMVPGSAARQRSFAEAPLAPQHPRIPAPRHQLRWAIAELTLARPLGVNNSDQSSSVGYWDLQSNPHPLP